MVLAELVEAAQARLEVIADTYLSMNAPIQWATPALLDQRHKHSAAIAGSSARRILPNSTASLLAQKTCQRLSVEGGWYAVLRVPVTQTDEELAVDLLRRKSVLVHPGHFYDFPSDGYLVLSLIPQQRGFRREGTLNAITGLMIWPHRWLLITIVIVSASPETDCSLVLLRS